MLTKKGKILVVVLFFIATLLTGRARLVLDDMTAYFRDDFREMMYLPRGKALKVIACGFDSPLADALFIKGMIYYAESFQNQNSDRTARRDYTFALFDVITDLSPRFSRAYQMGALFLTSSASEKSNYDGIKLLEKGVEQFADIVKSGETVAVDPRWLFHTLIANTYEVNIQARERTAGNMATAAEARQKAGEEFRLAAASPGAPAYVLEAAVGYDNSISGTGNIEDSLKIMLDIWGQIHQLALDRGDKDILPDLEERIEDLQTRFDNIHNTRQIESALSEASREYHKLHGKYPIGIADLLKDGALNSYPPAPLASEDDPETWLVLPNGDVKSALLARMETANHLNLLTSALLSYTRSTGKMLDDLRKLVEHGFLKSLPEPPLKDLGQYYHYDKEGTGLFENRMPYGPELPPDRK